jgi:hypothetical protein
MKCTPFNDSTARARFVVAAAAAAAVAALIGRRYATLPLWPTMAAERCLLENRVEVAAAHREEMGNMMNENDDDDDDCVLVVAARSLQFYTHTHVARNNVCARLV